MVKSNLEDEVVSLKMDVHMEGLKVPSSFELMNSWWVPQCSWQVGQ
jgi:hypothetical protein